MRSAGVACCVPACTSELVDVRNVSHAPCPQLLRSGPATTNMLGGSSAQCGSMVCYLAGDLIGMG